METQKPDQLPMVGMKAIKPSNASLQAISILIIAVLPFLVLAMAVGLAVFASVVVK